MTSIKRFWDWIEDSKGAATFERVVTRIFIVTALVMPSAIAGGLLMDYLKYGQPPKLWEPWCAGWKIILSALW
jgi:hypothetical protein